MARNDRLWVWELKRISYLTRVLGKEPPDICSQAIQLGLTKTDDRLIFIDPRSGNAEKPQFPRKRGDFRLSLSTTASCTAMLSRRTKPNCMGDRLLFPELCAEVLATWEMGYPHKHRADARQYLQFIKTARLTEREKISVDSPLIKALEDKDLRKSWIKDFRNAGLVTALILAISLSYFQPWAPDPVVPPLRPPLLGDPPTLNIQVIPYAVVEGGATGIYWTTTGSISSCEAKGDWSGPIQPGIGHRTIVPSEVVPESAVEARFEILCHSYDGSSAVSFIVPIYRGVTPPPEIEISVAPAEAAVGETVQVNWTVNYSVECVAKGAWSGGRFAGSTKRTQRVTITEELVDEQLNVAGFELECTGPGGSSTGSTQVRIIGD